MVRRPHRGFTLIEILVVLGIILLLLSMTLLGYMHIERAAGERSTRSRLEMLESILQQYEASAGTLSAVQGIGSQSITVTDTSNPPNQTDVSAGSGARLGVGGGCVYNTGLVNRTFSRIPSIAAMFAQLPANALLTNSDSSCPSLKGVTGQPGPVYVMPTLTTQDTTKPLPIVLDGWNNPIIYVQVGGLYGVYVGGMANGSGVSSTVTGTKMKVTSVDGRPFWASAGQDGNFSSGDDNVYSTAVKYTVVP